ncbi:MAG: hypothetical protein JWN65_4183 [Solirubrobacterales bacterium]|nr:hypothetical protein [Solirubrobacterales bacterium]
MMPRAAYRAPQILPSGFQDLPEQHVDIHLGGKRAPDLQQLSRAILTATFLSVSWSG